jgi:hypothetical protein
LIAIEEKLQTKNEGETEDSTDCTQKIYTTTYKGEIGNRNILKWMHPLETPAKAADHTTGRLIQIIAFCLLLLAFLFMRESFFGERILGLLFFTSVFIFLLLSGMGTLSDEDYVEAPKCKKCNRAHVCEEIEEPDIKEVSTEDSYTVTITRYWKCKYCEHRDSSESSENIIAYKEKKGIPKEIECKKCGKVGISPECRNPDIKMKESKEVAIFITTRYYRCKYCRHVNIKVEKEKYCTFDSPSI